MRITVLPKGFVVEADGTLPVKAAVEAAGYVWPSVCGGKASCKACVMEVEPDAPLAPMSRLERTELERTLPVAFDAARPLRLACQAVPLADVVVAKRGVRPVPAPASLTREEQTMSQEAST